MTKNQAIIEATQYDYEGLRYDDERELWQTLHDTGATCTIGGRYPETERMLIETGVIETRR